MEEIKVIIEYLFSEGTIISEAPLIFSTILLTSFLIIWRSIFFIFGVRLENAKSNIEKLDNENRIISQKYRNLEIENKELKEKMDASREKINKLIEQLNNGIYQDSKWNELSKVIHLLKVNSHEISEKKNTGVDIKGSNANGVFFRRADGSLDCEGVITEISNANGYRHTVIFPASYLSVPKIEIYPAGFVRNVKVDKNGFTYVSFSRPLPEAAILRYKAVGRWK
jgi:FtsZ-binding cell division protein ZapB